MRRLLIAFLLSFVLICPAVAQTTAETPASKEDVDKYLDAIHSHEMMKQMVEAMSKPMHQMVHDQLAKDKDKLPADFEERMNKVIDDMMKRMPFDEMMDAMTPTYQKHFTKEDMEALTAFYSTARGQKILREMPAIMAEAMQAMSPIMRKNIDYMTAQVQEQVTEMMKESAPKAPPAVKD